MNPTTELFNNLAKFLDQPMIVEGKRDAAALQALGFSRIFILNEHQGSMRERVERIASQLARKEKVCLLFDNDAEGRKLIARCATIVRELGFRVDSILRRELIKAGLSHVEGLVRFMSEQ